jgi:hypothetical protein
MDNQAQYVQLKFLWLPISLIASKNWVATRKFMVCPNWAIGWPFDFASSQKGPYFKIDKYFPF